MGKFGFWGSLASIVSLALMFVPFQAQSGDQNTTYGDQSPVITDPRGPLNLHYNNPQNYYNNPQNYYLNNPQKNPVLRNPHHGAVGVVPEPRLVKSMNDFTCLASGGTPIRLLEGEVERWQRVEITGGKCTGKVGWVAVENISYE